MKEFDLNFIFFPFPGSMECNPSSSDTKPGACYAALVAKHAESRGRFWQVHDALFDDGTLLDPLRAAELAGIAGAQSMEEILADTIAKIAVIRDVRSANHFGVQSTPTIFINGMGIQGAPVDWFLKEIIRREQERRRR
jgi:protein-disulfide isomerase